MTGCRDDLSSFKMATEMTINRKCCKSINTQENKACMQLTSSLKACSCAVFSESDSSSKFSSFIATSPCQLPLHKNHGCVKKNFLMYMCTHPGFVHSAHRHNCGKKCSSQIDNPTPCHPFCGHHTGLC